jgi:benzodiazapine receptor
LSLKQPPGNPPDWAFGPVWTILYGMMGYASHLAVQVADQDLAPYTAERATDCLGLYYAQLALNFAWMPMFFTAKRPKLALANIVTLTGLVVTMTAKMSTLPTSFDTTLLLAPYCAWMGYGEFSVQFRFWLEVGSWKTDISHVP